MRRLVIPFLVAVLAAPAAAQSLRIEGALPVTLRAGPGLDYPATGELYPGERAERGPCDEVGRWCVVSTDAAWGWLDTGVPVPAAPPVAPLQGLRPPPVVLVSPLAPARPGPASLAPEIVAAVPPAPGLLPVPGARPPRLLSTTEPMRNVTEGLVNLRAGPGTDAAIVGRLAPGEGGRIDVCDATERWCRIAPAYGPVGWVSSTLIGLRRM